MAVNEGYVLAVPAEVYVPIYILPYLYLLPQPSTYLLSSPSSPPSTSSVVSASPVVLEDKAEREAGIRLLHEALCTLEDLNEFQFITQEWSQFANDPFYGPPFCGTNSPAICREKAVLDAGEISSIKVHPDSAKHIDANTRLQCERCGSRCDVNFNILAEKNVVTTGENVAIMSYVHCPHNETGLCSTEATLEWKTFEENILSARKTVMEKLNALLNGPESLSKLPCSTFNDNVNPVVADLINTYRSLRTCWHSCILLRCHDAQLNTTMHHHEYDFMVTQCPVWGDLMTDYTLVEKGLISPEAITYTYDLSFAAADYIVRHKTEWEEELRWLNAYAGYRRHMPQWRFDIANRAARRVAVGLETLIAASEALGQQKIHANLMAYEEAFPVVRSRFQELHSAMVCLPAARRILV